MKQLLKPANSCTVFDIYKERRLMSENLGYFMMNANSQMNDNAINSRISKNL